MKFIVKLLVVIASMAGLIGCAVVPASSHSGRVNHSQSGYGQGLRTEPCQPYRADALIEWAKELDTGKQHTRTANVTVHDGFVSCRTTESAGSRMGLKK